MLKIAGAEAFGKYANDIEFGDYLPFKFIHMPEPEGPKLYWRTGDFSTTLVEIEIDRQTDRIISAILLLPGKISRDFPDLISANDNTCDGAPIADVRDWPDNGIKDEPGKLSVFVDSSRLLIGFSALVAAERTISVDNVTYGLDANGFMVWILVSNLSKDKLHEFENL